MHTPIGQSLKADQVLASADQAAAAALRELPEALILVFDRELRFVLTAGTPSNASATRWCVARVSPSLTPSLLQFGS